ncbi:MAG: hypothetical protein L3J96_02355, partial [Thermoplasmata archaeon]|nr:hypothetical protein [Thermoplasmata archaeon]
MGGGIRLLLLFGGADVRVGTDHETWAIGQLPLTVGSVNATPASIDVGLLMTLSVGVFGGAPPYNFVWTGLPGCPSLNKAVLSCRTKTVGDPFTVTVQVRDSLGVTQTTAPLLISVQAAVSISLFTSTPFTVIAGQTKVVLNVTALGGTPPYNYTFFSLPSGCAHP